MFCDGMAWETYARMGTVCAVLCVQGNSGTLHRAFERLACLKNASQQL
jgi:hypothetical protein